MLAAVLRDRREKAGHAQRSPCVLMERVAVSIPHRRCRAGRGNRQSSQPDSGTLGKREPAIRGLVTAATQQSQTTDAINKSVLDVNVLSGDAARDMSRAAEEVRIIAAGAEDARKVLEDIREKVRLEEEKGLLALRA